MKAVIQLFIILLALPFQLFAQYCAPNGITTDPANPVNPQRPSMVNWFAWTLPSYPLNLALTGINATAINNPFFATDNANIAHLYDPIDGIKDITPSQGWELIKMDFGYDVHGYPTTPGTTNPYLVLYNKYRSVLRILVARGEYNTFNGANIKINFREESPVQTSLLDHKAQLKPLDSYFNSNPKLFSIPDFLNLPLKWFYADFPMNYDPCTCLYESALRIDITLSSTSQVTGVTASTGDLATATEPTNAQKSRGSFAIGAFNTSKKAIQTYKSSTVFKEDISPALKKVNGTPDTAKKDNLNAFESLLKNSDFLRAGLNAIPYVGDALSVLDFFIGGGKKASGPQQVAVMPMTINMTSDYTGTINTTVPYNTITFRTPGSNPGNAPDSEYPYYNETMGLLNLLKTPSLLVGYYNAQYSGGAPFQQIFMKFEEDIKYVLNPAAKLQVVEMKAAILVMICINTMDTVPIHCFMTG